MARFASPRAAWPGRTHLAAAFLIAATLLASASPTWASPARLLSAEPGRARFVVDVPEIVLAPAVTDSSLSTIAIPGFDPQGAPGGPGLPVRIVMVAVPPTGGVSISAMGSSSETVSDVRLAGRLPAPPRTETPGMPAPRLVEAAPAASPPLARLLDVSWMRDQRIARIAIAPATWDKERARLEVRHRVEIEVRFDALAPAGRAVAEELDGFEPLYREVLVNYEQARAWRRPPGSASRAPLAGVGSLASSRSLSAARATVVPENSLYAGHLWVKIAIPSSGFYKVELSQILNSELIGGRRDRPLSWLRLFTWPGVPVLPEDSYCDSCDYKEVAIQFTEFPTTGTSPPRANKPDTLDDNREYFYFFAMGPSDWANLYDPRMPDTTFINHPYETRNFVYLTLDSTSALPGSPARIATENAPPGDTLTAVSPPTFPGRVHFEVDTPSEYWPDATPVLGVNDDGTTQLSGERWEKFFWASLTMGNAVDEPFDLPGLLAGGATHVRVRDWGLSELFTGISKSSGVPDHYLDVTVGPVTFARRKWDAQISQTFDTTAAGFSESGNPLHVQVPTVPDPNPRFQRFDRSGFAWIDAFYPRRFVPAADQLAFDSDPAGGTWLYRIGPFAAPLSAPPRVFDVTDPLAPVEILQTEYAALSGSAAELRFRRTESGQRHYRVITDANLVKLPGENVKDAPVSSLQNLRRPTNGSTFIGADFLLVYFDDFQAAADTLLGWRGQHLPAMSHAAPYKTFSVPISAIYDQFSGGRTDPAAIRNFLRAAFTYWSPRPTYVTFLGDGSFDFKNLTGQAPAGLPGSLIPSYESGYDDIVRRQYATDDWLLNVDDPVVVVPDFYGGRIPAGDADQAIHYVRDKLLPYERAAPLGEWRDRVMLIADDNQHGDAFDPIGWGHLKQTARLDVEAMPPEIDREYVYLHTYPDGPNATKPGAKADIIAGIEEGVVMANFIGHGSPFKLADESVFLDLDATALTNRTRPTIFIAASCDVGKFNNPSVKSLGENLVLNPNGGAVGVVSATEVAFSGINAELNLEMYRRIFQRDSLDGQFETPIAKSLLAAKTGRTNNQKYQLMGDAAVQPVLPRLFVETSLIDSAGQVVTVAQRGQKVQIRGRLLDRPGGAPLAYEGVTRLLVEDSAPIDTTPDCFGPCVIYPFRAAPMFRGDVAIHGGEFTTHFVVPMNARLGPEGRARPYDELQQPVTDAVGSASFTVANAGVIPTDDREGPRIALGFRGGALSVRPDALLRVDLFDPSGILITGRSPQNDIIVTLDEDSNQRTDITSSFRYAANSYQSGTAFFSLPGLPLGPHRVRVSAADNLAAGIAAPDHRSTAFLDFVVTENPSLKVTRAILFPNPTRSGRNGGGGQFVVDAPGDSVNVLLRIYTVAGRLVRSLEFHGGLAQVQIPWDGLDAEGDPLAHGTYLFKAQVYPRESTGASSGRQRAEADGRFVIIGP